MAAKKKPAILISVLITALVVGAGSYLLWGQEQPDSQTGENGGGEAEVSRAPLPGWEAYFPEPDSTTLIGEGIGEVRRLLGEPPFKLRSIAVDPAYNREIWIYLPYEEDPTGLYIYFKGNRVSASRLDEFNGLYDSGLLDDESFWLQ